MGLLSRISGDDIFISYSRHDGGLYAATLADKLTNEKFSCFIDRLGVRPDHDLPPELIQKIQTCKIFVVVTTANAARSIFVQKELLAFKETGRTILPIDFSGSFGRAIWYNDVPGLPAEPERAVDALIDGEPSDNVMKFIRTSFNYTRRNRRMARAFWVTSAILLLLIALSVGGILVARNQIAKAVAATARAEQETKRADQASALANAKSAEAAQRTLDAQRATDAAKSAKDEADRQRGLADEATALAKEKTALADAETKRAIAQTTLAETRKREADEQAERSRQLTYAANMQLGSRLYELGQVNNLTDLLKGINTTANLDLVGFEWLRLNHLTEGLIPFNAEEEKIEHLRLSARGDLVSKGADSLLLWNPATGEKKPLDVVSSEVSDFAFSPDGNSFAAVREFSVVYWDTANGLWSRTELDPNFVQNRNHGNKLVNLNRDQLEIFKFVTFSPDNKTLLTISRRGKEFLVRKWDVNSKQPIGEERSINEAVKAKKLEVLKVAFNGRFLIRYEIQNPETGSTAGQDALIDGELRVTALEHEASDVEYEYFFFPSGQQTAIVRANGEIASRPIEIFDGLASQGSRFELNDSTSPSGWKEIVASTNGRLVAALDGEEVRVWDTGTRKIVKRLRTANSCVNSSLAFSDDGTKLIVGGSDEEFKLVGSLTLWNVIDSDDVFNFDGEVPVALSRDGSALVTQGGGSGARTLNLWDTITRSSYSLTEANPAEDPGIGAFSSDGSHFLVISRENSKPSSIGVWEAKARRAIGFLHGSATCELTDSVSFSADGSKIVELCKEGAIVLMDTANGNLQTILIDNPDLAGRIRAAREKNEVAVDQIGEKLILVIAGGIATDDGISPSLIWDLRTGKQIEPACPSGILAISPDGNWQVVRDGEKIRLRRSADSGCGGEALFSAEDDIVGMVFSNDSKLLAVYYTLAAQGSSGALNPTLKVKDLTTNKTEDYSVQEADATGICVPFSASGLQISPSGRWVQFGNYFFDRSSKTLTQINGCSGSPVFSGDERRLITDCGDGTLRFWSLTSGQEVLSLKAHDKPVLGVALARDNGRLLTITENEAKLWRVKF